jgi:Sec-independent protein secretion pathway component TatC
MDIETIFGLPAHPLLVHVPVVLIPLCAAGAVWIVVWPSWRPRIGWIVVVLAGFTAVVSKLAADSGEALEDALDKESSLLEHHVELGDTFVWFAAAFFVAVLALMLWDRAQRRNNASGETDGRARATSPAAIVLSILVVVTAAAASFRVYQVGHSGAKSVWEQDSGDFDSSGPGSGDEG